MWDICYLEPIDKVRLKSVILKSVYKDFIYQRFILGGCFDSSLGDHHIHHLLVGVQSIAHLSLMLRLNLHSYTHTHTYIHIKNNNIHGIIGYMSLEKFQCQLLCMKKIQGWKYSIIIQYRIS